ncbi:MAG: tagatose 1,6-diphosphate aldolase [Trueperaceae bacterium]|nr:tagatose 1,6-diphosphate aldolase [Trueperaceae bacterium]
MLDTDTSPPTPTGLTAGKLRGLTTLANSDGVLTTIAVDQRPPIFKALARYGDRQPGEVDYDEIARVKTLLTRVLAPAASGVLIDPIWGHPHALTSIPGQTGLMSTLEAHDFAVVDGERRSHTIDGWSVAKIKQSGAAGVKLLAWDRPDASEATKAHQQALVEEVGAACREHDIPFILELLIYPLAGEDAGSAEYARAKPERVLGSVRTFADERFGVDLYKLELPVDLKHCAEFAGGAFDGTRREAVYDLAEVSVVLQDLNDAIDQPWVLLSAGVGPREFATGLELACVAGASGFLAGRAVWAEGLEPYPDLAAVETYLRDRSLPFLRQLSAIAETAQPWWHRYGDAPQLQNATRDWYKTYGS